MKNITAFLFSAPFMAVLLAIFGLSIAAATFIENDFGSQAARAIVYNARWFEVVILLGCINLTGRIIIKRLYVPQKFTIFLFHISFIIILSGAALTRYTGWEGTLSVREGESENKVLTDKTFITVQADQTYQFKLDYSPFKRNRFAGKILHNNKPLEIRLEGYIPNAYLSVEPFADGTPVAEFIYADSAGRRSTVIEQGENKYAGKVLLLLSEDSDLKGVNLSVRNDTLFFRAPFPVTSSSMDGSAYRILEAEKEYPFIPRQLYSFNDQSLVLNVFYARGRITAHPLPAGSGNSYDAAIVKLSAGNFSREVILPGKGGYPGIPKRVLIDNNEIILSYGSIYIELPFELKLNDFIIERYPGSRSPSSFESRVQLIDSSRNFTRYFKIYMNNILKYRGFRFYQSSYDPDELGTILSVNRGPAGTAVTYGGYILLAIGMISSLLIRNSRFRDVSSEIKKYQKIRNTLFAIILTIIGNSTANAQGSQSVIAPDASHASQFGRLLVQDNSGRIEPVNTLSSEVLRKLLREDNYRGMSAEQVFLGMCSNPSAWQFEPIIRVTNSQVLEFLGSREKYHSFSSFFENQVYLLQTQVADAYRKKPAIRTRFDNDIIKIDEKVNICYLVFTGELLRMFPVPEDSTHTWYNPTTVHGRVQTLDSIFTNNAFALYIDEVTKGLRSGDWKSAENVLNAIYQYQQKYSGTIIPSDKKISTEIFLNKTDIFSEIAKYYGIIGFLLLVLYFISLFIPGFKTRIPQWTGMVLICILFLIHTTGLGLRWYVSGHAPWSNGYEALTYVAWASALAGLVFARKSPLTTAVGSILAFLTLFVAHLSWMDPQITNLVPVLKSYWLVLHVATITASYGFLAMSALLAYINLLMISLHTDRNRSYIRLTMLEVTGIIEMALTVGIYLLTVGVFLGAVWANESWGRYWGWDPKETWALVTVIVYAFVLHMRMVPGLRGALAFNIGSLLAISSVIMTYFGVNYYLSGLHSYAKGDPLPVPSFVYITLAVILITAVIAGRRNIKLLRDGNVPQEEAVQ